MKTKKVDFQKRPASNYRYLRNCEQLHYFISKLLRCDEQIFLDIVNIVLKCKRKKDFKDYYQRYYELWYIQGKDGSEYLSLLWSIYKEAEDLGGIRGRFLEILLYYLLKREYNNSDDDVDMRCFISNGEKESEKEVDVFAWCKQDFCGEFYECKVDFEQVDEDKWQGYLCNLVNINNMFGNRNSYGFVSLANYKAIFYYLKDILGEQFGFGQAIIIGKEMLYSGNFSHRKDWH